MRSFGQDFPVNDLLHAGNQHLDSLQSEPLLSGPLLGQEVLEADGSRDPRQQQTLLIIVQLQRPRSLQLLSVRMRNIMRENTGEARLSPDPLDLVEVVDVEILGSDTPAVDILQSADDLLQ